MAELVCTKQELENIVEKAVEKGFDERKTSFITEETFQSRLEVALSLGFARMTYKNIKFWIGVLGFVFAIGVGWSNIQNRIDRSDVKIDNNTSAINEGGRYTQEEADVRANFVDQQLIEIKRTQESQFKEILEILKRLDN